MTCARHLTKTLYSYSLQYSNYAYSSFDAVDKCIRVYCTVSIFIIVLDNFTAYSLQITFFGSIEKAGANPTRITPKILKGDILHHSLALNKFRNEYLVAFDLDVNKDGRPDQVYAVRINGLGQLVESVLNATVEMASSRFIIYLLLIYSLGF